MFLMRNETNEFELRRFVDDSRIPKWFPKRYNYESKNSKFLIQKLNERILYKFNEKFIIDITEKYSELKQWSVLIERFKVELGEVLTSDYDGSRPIWKKYPITVIQCHDNGYQCKFLDSDGFINDSDVQSLFGLNEGPFSSASLKDIQNSIHVKFDSLNVYKVNKQISKRFEVGSYFILLKKECEDKRSRKNYIISQTITQSSFNKCRYRHTTDKVVSKLLSNSSIVDTFSVDKFINVNAHVYDFADCEWSKENHQLTLKFFNHVFDVIDLSDKLLNNRYVLKKFKEIVKNDIEGLQSHIE